jgi:glycosyltransferase involved in cell wall biosynthesis
MRDGIEVTFFVACYNEAPRIRGALEVIRTAAEELKIGYEVIVVDDGSIDGSAEVVEGYAREHEEMKIIIQRNKENRGLARSFVDAAFLGRGRYYRLVCGDNVEDKETMTQILHQRAKADIILPYYPDLPGKSVMRKLISRLYTFVIDLIGGYKIQYYNGCALYQRYHVMRWAPYDYGFGFQANLITTLLEEKATWKEIPVEGRHVVKEGGRSPLNLRNFLSTSNTVFEIGIRRLRRLFFG